MIVMASTAALVEVRLRLSRGVVPTTPATVIFPAPESTVSGKAPSTAARLTAPPAEVVKVVMSVLPCRATPAVAVKAGLVAGASLTMIPRSWVPAMVTPSPFMSSLPEATRRLPSRSRGLVKSWTSFAPGLTVRFPKVTAAFRVVRTPAVITRVPSVVVPSKVPEMATFPDAVIVFAAVLVIVPVLAKAPTTTAPELSRVPRASIVRAFVPAAMLPPEATVSVPPLTVLVAPDRVRAKAPVSRVPPDTVRFPATPVAETAVKVPPLPFTVRWR